MPEDEAVAAVPYRLKQVEDRLKSIDNSMSAVNTALQTGLQGVTSQLSALQITFSERFVSKDEMREEIKRANEIHAVLEKRTEKLFEESGKTHDRLDLRIDRNEDRVSKLEDRAWLVVASILGVAGSVALGLFNLLERKP